LSESFVEIGHFQRNFDKVFRQRLTTKLGMSHLGQAHSVRAAGLARYSNGAHGVTRPTLLFYEASKLPCHTSNANRHGFTLIELMVVIVLISIMTAMIIPEMKGTFEEALLHSTARELVNAFNLGYSQAVTLNQIHRVRLDRKNGRYFVEKKAEEKGSGFIPVGDLSGGEGKLDTRISIEIRRAEETPAAAPEPEAPLVSQDDSRIRNVDEPVVFYPDGTADSGEIRLRDREGFRLALRINPITARVDVVELEHESVP
jgi:type II secretion system protein H